MRAFFALALGLILWTACQQAAGERPPEPGRVSLTLLQTADSARVVVSWLPATLRANQLAVTSWDTRLVTVAGDTLARGTTTGTRDTLVTPWPAVPDSLRVRAAVRGVDAGGSRGAWGQSTILTLKLIPAPPDAPNVQVDTVTGRPQASAVRILPDSVRLALGDQSTLCGIMVFASGRWALRASERALCDARYQAALPHNARANALEQAWADTACWAWSSTNPLAVPVLMSGPCRASAVIIGLALTAVPAAQDRLRYAAAGDWLQVGPIVEVDQGGWVTCLRPGVARVTGRHPSGAEASTLVHCQGPAIPLLAGR